MLLLARVQAEEDISRTQFTPIMMPWTFKVRFCLALLTGSTTLYHAISACLSTLHWLLRRSTNSQQLFHTTANLGPAGNHSNCILPMGNREARELGGKGFLEKRWRTWKAFEKSNVLSLGLWLVCVCAWDGGTLSWMSRGHFFSCRNLKVPTWPCREA